MVLVNYTTRELSAKLVYYGPGLCGKTTNLQYIYDSLLPGDSKGKMVSLDTETDRTIFFDFLPLELGTIRGLKTRLQLYTVPGQVHYNATRKIVLKGADGIVFVADSQRSMKQSNIESYNNMKQNLADHGMKLEDVPLVLQFNKRDLPDIMSIEEMEDDLNEFNAPFWEAVALEGIGVEDTLKSMARLVLKSLAQRFTPEAVEAGEEAAGADAAAAPPAASTTAPPAAAPVAAEVAAAGATAIPAAASADPLGGGVPAPADPLGGATAIPAPAAADPLGGATAIPAPADPLGAPAPAAAMASDPLGSDAPAAGSGDPFGSDPLGAPAAPAAETPGSPMLAPSGELLSLDLPAGQPAAPTPPMGGDDEILDLDESAVIPEETPALGAAADPLGAPSFTPPPSTPGAPLDPLGGGATMEVPSADSGPLGGGEPAMPPPPLAPAPAEAANPLDAPAPASGPGFEIMSPPSPLDGGEEQIGGDTVVATEGLEGLATEVPPELLAGNSAAPAAPAGDVAAIDVPVTLQLGTVGAEEIARQLNLPVEFSDPTGQKHQRTVRVELRFKLD